MFSIKHLGRVGALVSAAAFLASTSSNLDAATPPPAEVGIVFVIGSPVSGGDIQYQFELNATTPGTLTVQAKVKGKKLKATLPDLVQTPAAGVSTITGPAYTIPNTFVGTAKLQTKISFNGKKLTTRTVQVVVTAPPPPPAAPTAVTLRDVGFENLVTLNGSAVPAGELGASPTYEWTQLAGMPAVLSSTSALAPTFTTGHLTNFVDMADKFGGIDGIGFDAEQVKESTYKFQLVVSGNGQSRTGVFTVVCTSMAPKQPNTPIGVLTYFKAETNSTDWVLLSKPPGSAATLINPNSLTPALRPDLEGNYVVKDNVSGLIRTNTGASWTGVEFCALCHGPGNQVGLQDIVSPWEKTGHATFFKEMINSGPAYYNESCIACHTVGYDKTPTAVNNGFDDVAANLGWQFPTSINSNNWNNLPYALKNLSGIQCESCHGPGSRHPGPTSVSLNVAVCAQCHQDGHFHTRVEQWERSPHFKGFEELSEDEGTRATCARCHAPDGYVDVAKRIAGGQDVVTASRTNNYATGVGELICQGCHDPHHTFDNPERHQLRIFDEVVIGAPAAAGSIVLSNQGASATCMYCHNSRNLPEQLTGGNPYYRSTRSGNISGPHYSPASEVLNGLGALTYGVPMGNTFHTYGANCVSCHMHPNPAIGAPGHNLVGDHTFKMSYLDGDTKVENLASCNQCHAGTFAVDKFDFKSLAAKDWDGNGSVDGIQTETLGLLDSLRIILNTTGLQSISNAAGAYTGFRTNGLSTVFVVKEAQLMAAWNWMLINRDNSKGVHNPLFTLRLLQNTYTDVSTNYYGDVSQTFQNAFPNAVLR